MTNQILNNIMFAFDTAAGMGGFLGIGALIICLIFLFKGTPNDWNK